MISRTVGVNITPLSHLGPFDAPWLKTVAQQVERLGFDTLWCGDHIIMHNAILDAMTVLATFGAVTERLKIGTGVLLIPLRHPVAIAKQVTSLDVLTQGRFQFGVGVGGEIPHEFAAVNIRVHERGRRTDEGLEIITRVLSQEKVSYAGKYYQIEDVTLLPRPQQPLSADLGWWTVGGGIAPGGALWVGLDGVYEQPATSAKCPSAPC